MARLSERDARAWQALAMRIADTIESRLSPRVLANRGPVPVAPIGPSLRRARTLARELAARSEVALRTDVRSFYPSVTPSVAYRSLVGLNVEPSVASRSASMLEGWGSEGYAGLPIGPPGSAIIANAILAPVDADLRSSPFLRWVDDYLIAARGEQEAWLILERIDESLARVGLERSAPKTEILGRGSSVCWPGTYGPR